MSKTFLFQDIQFSQTLHIQTFQFSISLFFLYILLNVKTVLFKTNQFNVEQFRCQRLLYFKQFDLALVCSLVLFTIDRAMSGATTPCQSRPGSDDNEWVPCIPAKLQHDWDLIFRFFSAISKTLWGSLTTLQRSILQPQPTGQTLSK